MARSINIDVIDRKDSKTKLAKFLKGEVVVSSLDEAVKQVIKKTGRHKIERLRFFGHGTSGLQGVGGGVQPKKGQVIASHFDGRNGFFGGSQLRQLDGRFCPNGWFSEPIIELHGCNVGEGERGAHLVYFVAKLLRVKVRAGEAIQRTGSGAGLNDKFEGFVIEIAPGESKPRRIPPFRQ